jgi:hypothetical protein
MSLFFYGIVLSYYNSCNLSPTSEVTVHNIFKSFACLSEFFVFLYIGMGLFTAKYFRHWSFIFFFICIIICIIARFLNTFPLTFLANFVRKVKVPVKMQLVIWFAGLRGAISFALSLNMPMQNRDLYVSTTLSIVVFTTVVFGGLTEPILTYTGMRRTDTPEEVLLHNLGEGLGLDDDFEGSSYKNVSTSDNADDDSRGLSMREVSSHYQHSNHNNRNSINSSPSSHGLIDSRGARNINSIDEDNQSSSSSSSPTSFPEASPGIVGRLSLLLSSLPKPN